MDNPTQEYIANKGLVLCVTAFGSDKVMITVARTSPPETFDPDNFKHVQIAMVDASKIDWTPPKDAAPLQPFPIEVLGEDLSMLGITLNDTRAAINMAEQLLNSEVVASVELGTVGDLLTSRE